MESRRLKNKKQELENYQKRVVAYAKRQKNTFYMLGDWLLTLCALGIILVEEIYKFFRYRLNLESFSRFLREDVRWYQSVLPVNQAPSGLISIIVCLKAYSLAQPSASLRPW